MPESNKGYQMLKKMGWKEGQTLGTTDLGLTEPVRNLKYYSAEPIIWSSKNEKNRTFLSFVVFCATIFYLFILKQV